jgi:hypothetical protein
VANFKVQTRREGSVDHGLAPRAKESVDAADRELPVAALAGQLRLVAHELRFQGDDFDLETMARELVTRIAGPLLNLDGLEPTLKRFVAAMPAEAWQALQRHAQSAGGVSITSVHLDAELLSNRLVHGLRELPALERVFVAAPTTGACIDFSDLQGTNQPEGPIRPEKIILEGDAPRGLWFKVPGGVTVEARGQSGPGLWKSLVFYTDREGHINGQANPVHGQVHAGDAGEFRQLGVFSKDDPQARAHAIRLNLRALMDNGDVIMCRRLVAQLLNDLMAGKPASFKHFATEAGISAHVPESVDADLDRMLEQGSCAIYKPDRFGEMAAKQFEGMQVGDSRLFAVSTGGHLLGLRLLVKERSHGGVMRREHVVNLYDPTYTAKLEEVTLVGDDLSLLRSKSLADCCVDKREVHEYFGDGGYLFGSLFRWPPGPARQQGTDVPVSIHVSPEDVATGGFLHVALDDGHVPLVRQSMLAMRAQGLGMDKDELDAIAGNPAIPGLYRAVSTGSPPGVVQEYLEQVLDFPPRLLGSDTKFRLCRAEHRDKTVLRCGLELGRADMVLSILRPVMAAPVALRGERYKFLLSPSPSGQPMLSELCAAQPLSPLTRERALRCEAMHEYLKEIVNSQVLSDAEKESLVSAYGGPPGGELPAARLALNSGNPGEAAAMLLAILESEALPALKTRLLAALGVSAEEVLAAFSQTRFDKGAQDWMFNTILRIEAHALS